VLVLTRNLYRLPGSCRTIPIGEGVLPGRPLVERAGTTPVSSARQQQAPNSLRPRPDGERVGVRGTETSSAVACLSMRAQIRGAPPFHIIVANRSSNQRRPRTTLDDHRHPCSERAPVARRRNYGSAGDFTRSLWYRGARGAVFRTLFAHHTRATEPATSAGLPCSGPPAAARRISVGWRTSTPEACPKAAIDCNRLQSATEKALRPPMSARPSGDPRSHWPIAPL
jgi:hypothetical protein